MAKITTLMYNKTSKWSKSTLSIRQIGLSVHLQNPSPLRTLNFLDAKSEPLSGIKAAYASYVHASNPKCGVTLRDAVAIECNSDPYHCQHQRLQHHVVPLNDERDTTANIGVSSRPVMRRLYEFDVSRSQSRKGL